MPARYCVGKGGALMNAHPALPRLLHAFFYDWAIQQRSLSPHTIRSYRDTWRLFLRFAAEHHDRRVDSLGIEDLDDTSFSPFSIMANANAAVRLARVIVAWRRFARSSLFRRRENPPPSRCAPLSCMFPKNAQHVPRCATSMPARSRRSLHSPIRTRWKASATTRYFPSFTIPEHGSKRPWIYVRTPSAFPHRRR